METKIEDLQKRINNLNNTDSSELEQEAYAIVMDIEFGQEDLIRDYKELERYKGLLYDKFNQLIKANETAGNTFIGKIIDLKNVSNTEELETKLIGIEMDLDIAQREHGMTRDEAYLYELLLRPYNERLYKPKATEPF